MFILAGCSRQSPGDSKLAQPIYFQKEKQDRFSKSFQKYFRYDDSVIALINATVFDGNGNPPRDSQTILIIGGVIQAVGDNSSISVPEDARIVDCTGKTIIPGIVGMHNHLHIPRFPFIGEVASKFYLAAGVTTIQTCGSASPQKEVELANQIENGQALGPTIFASGPYFTGPGGSSAMIIPQSHEQIRDTIRYWTERGVRWFKVYRDTRPDDLQNIVEEAHKANARVTGHLCSITFEQATELSIDGIEHGFNSMSDFRVNKSYGICDGEQTYIDELDITSPEVKAVQQKMIDNNVFLTSTLAIFESSIPQRAVADERSLRAMTPALQSRYYERRWEIESRNPVDTVREIRLSRIMAFEKQFFDMGGLLVAGVDAGRHVVPGYGDQRNYELLLEAGFSPAEVIQIMTSNGALALGEERIGSLEVGKKADLVVIDGSIESNIRKVEFVFKDGYGFDSKLILSDLDAQFVIE